VSPGLAAGAILLGSYKEKMANQFAVNAAKMRKSRADRLWRRPRLQIYQQVNNKPLW